jgi:hypothetical protein
VRRSIHFAIHRVLEGLKVTLHPKPFIIEKLLHPYLKSDKSPEQLGPVGSLEMTLKYASDFIRCNKFINENVVIQQHFPEKITGRFFSYPAAIIKKIT